MQSANPVDTVRTGSPRAAAPLASWSDAFAMQTAACRLAAASLLALAAVAAFADEPRPADPAPLSACDAVRFALERNPELAAVRRQHGVAAAGIVIARAYPFNPVWEGRTRAAFGGDSNNHVTPENTLLLEVELRGQGKQRRAAAAAALSRVDWEIANREVDVSVRTARTFDAVVYRHKKYQLLLDTVELNSKQLERVQELVKAGLKLKKSDEIALKTELADARAQVGAGRSTLTAAWSELRRVLGVVDEPIELQGDLTAGTPPDDGDLLTQAALERRSDLFARRAAVAEADARLRLQVANRFGNVTVGPTYEYDATRNNLIGAQFAVPLPVFNTHRGEILQHQAERAVAAAELRQAEVQTRQDVRAALVRLKQARQWVELYDGDVLPNLENNLKEMRQLLEQGEAGGVNILNVLDVQRKLLKARDGRLDALFELRMAVDDLAAAVGDPWLAVGPCPPP
jgi:cobalt-zinc-cadmium efflux system outer membrane protein